jgi:hypothetical protein
MTSSTPEPETRHRDPYTVVVWERHGEWARRLRRSLRVEVEWLETRSWQQCQSAAASGPGCVVIAPGDDATLADCVAQIQQLRRRLHPETMVTVIGRFRLKAAEWICREAGAAGVATDSLGVAQIARLIERDWQQRPPSRLPLDELLANQLPWRPWATGR